MTESAAFDPALARGGATSSSVSPPVLEGDEATGKGEPASITAGRETVAVVAAPVALGATPERRVARVASSASLGSSRGGLAAARNTPARTATNEASITHHTV